MHAIRPRTFCLEAGVFSACGIPGTLCAPLGGVCPRMTPLPSRAGLRCAQSPRPGLARCVVSPRTWGWLPATGTACAGAIGSRERGASWFSRDAFLSPKESVRAMTNAPSERGISVQKIRRGIRDLPWRLIEFARVSSERDRVHLAVRAAPRYALGVRWSRGMMYDVYGGRSGKTRTGTRMRAVASSSDLPRPSADELADPAPATEVSAGQCR